MEPDARDPEILPADTPEPGVPESIDISETIAEAVLATDGVAGLHGGMFGEAATGELEDDRLAAVIHANHFWFAWSAFFPDSELRTADFFGS